jgi:hypothetical protein
MKFQVMKARIGGVLPASVLWLFVCCLPVIIHATDLTDYPPVTVSTVIARHVALVPEDAEKPKQNRIYVTPGGKPFSSTGTIKGNIKQNLRPLDEATRAMLSMLEETRGIKGKFLKLFKNELKFRDTDGMVHWLPIQQTHLEAMINECPKKDCRLRLDMVFFMIRGDGKALIPINEFEVQKKI